ncbi:OmpA family protein [Brevundimonas sp.]|uniref:OmpA family protein n=1 Tax=Brevundimonas sp. TaxID=1871086 RepID=UPI001DEB0C98|nr:OmpA family protein [Brevundimonas sp.]MBL0947482.1 OmpA family protein [Brevundimonas sp.]
MIAAPSALAGQQVYRAEDTVEIEHEDRVFRLNQAVDRLGITPRPRFNVVRVPRDRMPANFKVSVPVLRVSFSERTFFDTAQWRILPTGLRAVEAVAAAARGEAPDVAIFVAGHTDNVGGDEYNQNLSVRRADAVSEAMMRFGVGDVALWRVGFGESAPLYANDSDVNRSYNRRVEFLFGARVEPVVHVLSGQREEQVCISSNVAESRRCLVELPARTTFVATQATRRPIGVGGDGRVSAPVPAGGRSASSTSGPGSLASAPVPQTLTIPLHRPRTIQAPRR